MITILLPTRQRLNGLLRVLDTAQQTHDGFGKFEILLKFDYDDRETYEQWMDVREKYDDYVRTFIWPRGRGYLDLYKYNNDLASFANKNTDWFLIMNDDAYFTKNCWNRAILDHGSSHTPKILLDTAELFPCINKAAYEAMGTISKANHADTYLKMVGEQANCLEMVDIGILHEAHKFEDTVRREGQAVYAQEWEEQKKFIEEDVKRIKEKQNEP